MLGQLIYGILYLAMALGTVAWGTRIYRRARREAMMPGSELVKRDSRPVVLYLRSFLDDTDTAISLRARATDGRILPERFVKISFEEVVTDHLWGYGPVLAIGDPRTKGELVPLGAARDYETDTNWQEAATEFMRQSSMIVVIAGATRGLAWEVDTIVKQGLVSKLVILLPPLDASELQQRWQSLLTFAIAPMLPAEVDLARVRGIVFPSGHGSLITGSERNDWTYEAVLDEAALVIAHQTSSAARRMDSAAAR